MRARFRLLLTVATAALLVVALPSGATATHSVPSPKYFWDPDNNNIPGPEPKVDPSGGFWESLRYARLDAALAEWTNDTQFDPSRVSTGNQDAYVDGTVGPCLPNGTFNQPTGTVLAVVCRQQTAIFQGPGPTLTHYRLTDLDVYFNMENPDSPDWWIGSTLTSDPGRLDFQGVMTHELGHWIRLIDVYDSTSCTRTSEGQQTMCGDVRADGRLDTWRYRSLHSHDISSANAVY